MKTLSKGLVLALGVCTAPHAQEVYSTWSHHRDVFLNTTNTTGGADVATDVTGFPVLVRLDARDSTTFTQAATGGADIRFTKADDVTRLKHQIDHWDAAARRAAIWVLVDTVKGNNKTQKFRMHWGKTGAADSSSGTAVFSNGFTNVWHLGNASGTAPRPNAITGGTPATPLNFPAGYQPVRGLIGMADTLRGGEGGGNASFNDHLNLGTITTNYANGFTFSAWLYNSVVGSGTTYYTASENSSDGAGLIVLGIQGGEFDAGAKFRQRNAASASNGGIINGGSGDMISGVIANQWVHVLYTMGTDLTGYVYVNGVAVASGQGSPAFQTFSNAARTVNQLGTTLGHMNYADNSFAGIYDEARLANFPRSAAWAKLEFVNQRAAGGLAFFDSAAPRPVALATTAASRAPGFTARAERGTIVFRVPASADWKRGSARVTLVDMWGRTVWRGAFAPGADRLVWNGRAASGHAVTSGVYIARFEAVDAQGRAVVRERKVPYTR